VTAFDWSLFLSRLFDPAEPFWRALATTLGIAVVAQIAGVALGFLAVIAQRVRFWPLKVLTYLYIWVFRGTPIVVQIFFIYFGANLFLGFDLFPREVGILGFTISGAILAGTVALALNEGAYMSEIIRAGIDSIDRGQLESSLAVGMTRRLAMRRIILPQAARVIIPPLGNQFNYMLKTTSLLAFIGVYEMFRDAQVHYSVHFQPVEVFFAVALWYLLLTTLWAFVQVRLERKFGASERAEGEGWFARILGTGRSFSAGHP
jgi:polar amino acid transport system permease protein